MVVMVEMVRTSGRALFLNKGQQTPNTFPSHDKLNVKVISEFCLSRAEGGGDGDGTGNGGGSRKCVVVEKGQINIDDMTESGISESM